MKSLIFRSLKALLALVVLALAGAAPAQAAPKRPGFPEVVPEYKATIEPAVAGRGEVVTWKFTMRLLPGWHTYPSEQVDPKARGNITKFQFPASGDVVAFGGKLKEPAILAKPEPLLEIKELRYVEGDNLVWERKAVINPSAEPGARTIKVKVQLQVCDKDSCLPSKTLDTEAALTINTAEPIPVSDDWKAVLATPATPLAPPSQPAGPSRETKEPSNPGGQANAGSREQDAFLLDAPTTEEYQKRLDSVLEQIIPLEVEDQGLLAFILAGVFWGGVSLITPCVFPMIPITVSYFLKQSEKSHHRPLTMAVVYCSTIVVVLTTAAVLLLSFFRVLSISPIMNYGMGLLFIAFALSLFGMYEIELPTSLAQFTSAREGKGGIVGTMFMALTFTILSFACVAPFLGGFGGTSASDKMGWPARILGGLAFALTFASPFFFLALFPSLLKKLPRSGSWLNSVKVVMGFLEFAAAFKFFRAAELVGPNGASFFTFDLVLGIWVALCFLCGLYLLGVYRLPHDTPAEHLGVPRLLVSLAFLGLALYLMPALFKFNAQGEKQRPSGIVYAWVDSFLLPEPVQGKGEVVWSSDLKRAIERARAEHRLVFVDVTGELCVNCNINEKNVFSKPEFQRLFSSYVLVKLYTDSIPGEYYAANIRSQLNTSSGRRYDDARINEAFQGKAFNSTQLPLYVILEPQRDGKVKVVAIYDEGKINSEATFAKFLKNPLTAGTATAQAQLVN